MFQTQEPPYENSAAYDARSMAITISTAPMPETSVKTSPRNSVEIATATTISESKTMADVTGERCFSPLSHK